MQVGPQESVVKMRREAERGGGRYGLYDVNLVSEHTVE